MKVKPPGTPPSSEQAMLQTLSLTISAALDREEQRGGSGEPPEHVAEIAVHEMQQLGRFIGTAGWALRIV